LKGNILSTLKISLFQQRNNASIKDRSREYQLSERVWGQEKKNIFFLSPINSRKEGRKKGELFYPRRYIAASGKLLAKTRGRYRNRFFLELQKCE